MLSKLSNIDQSVPTLQQKSFTYLKSVKLIFQVSPCLDLDKEYFSHPFWVILIRFVDI